MSRALRSFYWTRDASRGAFNYAFNRTGTESLRISSNLGNRPGCGKTGKNRKTSNTIGRTTETDRQRDSPIHRKADLALRRIGCENSHLVLDLTTRGLPVLRGTCYEHSHLDLARSPNHHKPDPARFGEYAVNNFPRWRMLILWFTSLFLFW